MFLEQMPALPAEPVSKKRPSPPSRQSARDARLAGGLLRACICVRASSACCFMIEDAIEVNASS